MTTIKHGELRIKSPGASSADRGASGYGVLYNDGDFFIFTSKSSPEIISKLSLDSSAWTTPTADMQSYCLDVDCGSHYLLLFESASERTKWDDAIKRLTSDLDEDRPANPVISSEVTLWMLSRGASKPDAAQFTASMSE